VYLILFSSILVFTGVQIYFWYLWSEFLSWYLVSWSIRSSCLWRSVSEWLGHRKPSWPCACAARSYHRTSGCSSQCISSGSQTAHPTTQYCHLASFWYLQKWCSGKLKGFSNWALRGACRSRNSSRPLARNWSSSRVLWLFHRYW